MATTVSARDRDYAKALGADQVIDYQNERFEQVLSGFDAVFDNAGGDTTKRSFGVLKRGGILVSMAGQPDAALAEKHGVTAIGQYTKTSTEQLNRLADLVDHGVIRIQVADGSFANRSGSLHNTF